MERTSSQTWFWPEWIIIIGRFPSLRSDQSVLKWNVRVLKTGSGQNGPAHGSEPLSSPAPVGQSAGIWKVMEGKMYTRALDLSIQTALKLARTGSFWPARPNNWKMF